MASTCFSTRGKLAVKRRRDVAQYSAVTRPIGDKLVGAIDDQITQPAHHRRDRQKHQQRPQRPRDIDPFENSHDGIEKIGQQDGEQQSDHDIRRKVQKCEHDSQGNNALRRVGTRRNFDVFDLHNGCNFTIAHPRIPANCGLPQTARLRYRRTYDHARCRTPRDSSLAPGLPSRAGHSDCCDLDLLPAEVAARDARRADAGGHRAAGPFLSRRAVGAAGNGRMAAHHAAALCGDCA